MGTGAAAQNPAAVYDLKATPNNVHRGFFDASLKPVLRIDSGSVVRSSSPLEDRAAASHLMEPDKYTPAQIAEPAKTRAWELVGLYLYHHRRVHEALSILWGLYQQLLKGQKIVGRIHKGTPLVWISDCFGM